MPRVARKEIRDTDLLRISLSSGVASMRQMALEAPRHSRHSFRTLQISLLCSHIVGTVIKSQVKSSNRFFRGRSRSTWLWISEISFAFPQFRLHFRVRGVQPEPSFCFFRFCFVSRLVPGVCRTRAFCIYCFIFLFCGTYTSISWHLQDSYVLCCVFFCFVVFTRAFPGVCRTRTFCIVFTACSGLSWRSQDCVCMWILFFVVPTYLSTSIPAGYLPGHAKCNTYTQFGKKWAINVDLAKGPTKAGECGIPLQINGWWRKTQKKWRKKFWMKF